MKRHGGEIAKELAQAISFGILGAIFGHLFEQGLGLRLDNGQLEKHGRIEHGICMFLIGEYPFGFARTNTGPTLDGFVGRNTTILMVANNAPKQSVIGGGYVIVVV